MDLRAVRLKACATSPDLILEIRLNAQIQFSGPLTSDLKEIEFLFDDSTPVHVIEISMSGKLLTHTVLNSDNEIVRDQLIKIQDFSLDQINLGNLFFEKSVYTHNFNGSQPEMTTNKFFGIMGCNGTVRFEFTSPVFMWLLENM